jgi:hypothetical protein
MMRFKNGFIIIIINLMNVELPCRNVINKSLLLLLLLLLESLDRKKISKIPGTVPE